jgi:hypothetical protein
MKIEQSKVRVDMPKEKNVAGGLLKVEDKSKTVKPKVRAVIADPEPDFGMSDVPEIKPSAIKPSSFKPSGLKPKKAIDTLPSISASPLRDDYSALREAVTSVQRLRMSAQQELDQIKKMRSDAVRYQMETATRARSEANQLILHTRMATQREIEELIRKASEDIQKMLADIRVIRITAQEELSAQRKFTDAAKLNSLSFSFKEQMEKAMNKEPLEKTVSKPKRQVVTSRSL